MESALQESWYRVEDMHRVMTPALIMMLEASFSALSSLSTEHGGVNVTR